MAPVQELSLIYQGKKKVNWLNSLSLVVNWDRKEAMVLVESKGEMILTSLYQCFQLFFLNIQIGHS